MIFNISFCQSKYPNSDEKLVLTASIPALFDPYDGSSLRLGLEFPLSDKNKVSLEAGKYFSDFTSIKKNIKGNILNPSIKFYFTEREATSIEYLFKDFSFDTQDSIKVDNININKTYRIHRKVHGIALKYYYRQYLFKNLFYEFYAGLGIRYIISRSNLTPLENQNRLDDELHGSTQIENEINRTGNFIRPNIQCGVKLGYKFF